MMNCLECEPCCRTRGDGAEKILAASSRKDDEVIDFDAFEKKEFALYRQNELSKALNQDETKSNGPKIEDPPAVPIVIGQVVSETPADVACDEKVEEVDTATLHELSAAGEFELVRSLLDQGG